MTIVLRKTSRDQNKYQCMHTMYPNIACSLRLQVILTRWQTQVFLVLNCLIDRSFRFWWNGRCGWWITKVWGI